jgi:hypothetical protein
MYKSQKRKLREYENIESGIIETISKKDESIVTVAERERTPDSQVLPKDNTV